MSKAFVNKCLLFIANLKNIYNWSLNFFARHFLINFVYEFLRFLIKSFYLYLIINSIYIILFFLIPIDNKS